MAEAAFADECVGEMDEVDVIEPCTESIKDLESNSGMLMLGEDDKELSNARKVRFQEVEYDFEEEEEDAEAAKAMVHDEANVVCVGHGRALRLVDPKHLLHKAVDKSDRATSEQVLDPRTRMILYKLVSSGVLKAIHGCVSTGKEANVYHSETDEGENRAIKVYKTSILVFKDRDRYVSGEHRFNNGYCKSNPRRMVRLWAEKELRNLRRLVSAGLPAPNAFLLKSHVLLMQFIGDSDGTPAPRLRDAKGVDVNDAYFQVAHCMWVMYNCCKLVHADLSEYNILYYNGLCYFIDVSQSVEHEHPRAHEFLKMDCTNVTDYFCRAGASKVLPAPALFDLTTDTSIYNATADSSCTQGTLYESSRNAFCIELSRRLDKHEQAKSAELQSLSSTEDKSHDRTLGDAVFAGEFAPRTLEDVFNAERDVARFINTGRAKELPYHSLLADFSSGEDDVESIHSSSSEDDSEDSSSSFDDDDDEEGHRERAEKPPRHGSIAHLSSEERKAHKRAVKEAKREGRKSKTPKSEKKRRAKIAARRTHK